jgi:hypothetical protein
MKKLLTMLVSTGLAVLLFAGFYTARADEWDKATKVTFGEAVMVPGQTLQPGTYYFKLLDSQADRHIVQIFNEDHTQLITTIMAIPNYRLQPTDKTVITYSERPSGQPVALEAWFYPGDNFGQQFVYPKSVAEELSKLNNTQVPSTGSEQAYSGSTDTNQSSTSQGMTSSTSADTSSTSTSTATSTQPSTDSAAPANSQSNSYSSQTTTTTTQPSIDTSTSANAQQGSSYSPAPTANPNSTQSSSTSQSTTETPARETTTPSTTSQQSARVSDERSSANSSATSRDSLPQTGSLLPLVGLVSLVLLGAATILRVALRS